MKEIENIYDKENFFNEYQTMRQDKINANDLIEIPIMKTMLPNLEGKTILDLGCGAGGMSRYFVENGAKKVVAIDISKNMIEEAKKYDCSNIDYRVLALENLDEIEEEFDLVFSSLAFHYVEDFSLLMQNISRLLKKNGILLYSQENPIATAVKLEMGEKKYIEKDGKRYYLLNNYNDISSRILFLKHGGTIYHRNFETIINTIINNAMKLIEIKEPLAPANAVELDFKYSYYKDRPLFLFVKAIKE